MDNYKLLLVPPELEGTADYTHLQLPHPSRNTSKTATLSLLLPQDKKKLFQFAPYEFKSEYLCAAKRTGPRKISGPPVEDTARSVFLVDPTDRRDGMVLQDASLKMLLPYDVAFSVISAYCARDEPVKNESEYATVAPSSAKALSGNGPDRFLTARDYQDMLIESDHQDWSKVPLDLLEEKLRALCETVQEGGDDYYKLTPVSIAAYLAQRKVQSMLAQFPGSVPVPFQWPEDVKQSMRVVRCCQLLVSLLPKRAYNVLISDDTTQLSMGESTSTVAGCFEAVRNYQKEHALGEQERKLLAESAMQVGRMNGAPSGKSPNNISKVKIKGKPLVPKKRVAVGRGAIDGFFKKKAK